MSCEADQTMLMGPTEKTLDAQELLERAGWNIVHSSNGGPDARIVVDGGYWPQIEAMVSHLGWWAPLGHLREASEAVKDTA